MGFCFIVVADQQAAGLGLCDRIGRDDIIIAQLEGNAAAFKLGAGDLNHLADIESVVAQQRAGVILDADAGSIAELGGDGQLRYSRIITQQHGCILLVRNLEVNCLIAVLHAVSVAVLLVRIIRTSDLIAVPDTVAVGVFLQRIRVIDIDLIAVAQTVGVTVGMTHSRAELELLRIGQAVLIAVSICVGYAFFEGLRDQRIGL